MNAFRTETRIQNGGDLTLHSLPFPVGEEVEVIVLPTPKEAKIAMQDTLLGSVLRYERPTDPVDEDEWESA